MLREIEQKCSKTIIIFYYQHTKNSILLYENNIKTRQIAELIDWATEELTNWYFSKNSYLNSLELKLEINILIIDSILTQD